MPRFQDYFVSLLYRAIILLTNAKSKLFEVPTFAEISMRRFIPPTGHVPLFTSLLKIIYRQAPQFRPGQRHTGLFITVSCLILALDIFYIAISAFSFLDFAFLSPDFGFYYYHLQFSFRYLNFRYFTAPCACFVSFY